MSVVWEFSIADACVVSLRMSDVQVKTGILKAGAKNILSQRIQFIVRRVALGKHSFITISHVFINHLGEDIK